MKFAENTYGFYYTSSATIVKGVFAPPHISRRKIGAEIGGIAVDRRRVDRYIPLSNV